MGNLPKFGNVVSKFSGYGVLHANDGDLRSCKFKVVQNTDGTLYALCKMQEFDANILNLKTAQKLTGIVEDKKRLTLKTLIRTDYNHESNSKETLLQIAFIGRELTVESEEYSQSDDVEFRFALTNFAFRGTEFYTLMKENSTFSGLQLPLETGHYGIVIRPVEDYRAKINEIRATQRPDVTCDIIVKNVTAQQEQNVIDAIGDLCLLLTLARGCRVEWLYYDVLLPNGETSKSYYRDAIIKPYSGYSLIAIKPAEDIMSFVEGSYPILQKKKEEWEFQKAVDIYTDAKLEADLLESRGLKMVVVMEHLKSRYLEHICKPAKVNIVDSQLFKEARNLLVGECKKVVQQIFPGIEPPEAQMMADHAQGFNYYSFGRSLSEICIALGLQINSKERRRFVEIRNELVHRFSFLNDSNEDPGEQYNFLMTFVGKILLAILEYDGYYVDRIKLPGYEGNTEMRVKLSLQRMD